MADTEVEIVRIGRPEDNEPYPAFTPAEPESPKGPVYIAGPWRGHDKGNKPAFDAVEQLFKSNGWDTFNPHTLNTDNGIEMNQPIEDAIRFDIEAILKSKAICLLPGWRASEGVRVIEAPLAKVLGLEFHVAWYEAGQWFSKPAKVEDLSVEGIDQTARSYVYGARAQTYGHPRNDFAIIAGMWRSIIKGRIGFFTPSGRIEDIDWDKVINDELVSILMSALKLARLTKSPGHRDSQVDVCGYMLTLARLQETPEEIAAWSEAESGRTSR